MGIQYISLRRTAEKVLRLSRCMLRQAINKEWDELARVETDRGNALKHLFDHPEIKQCLPMLSDILYEVLEVDRECIQITEKERFTLLQNLHHQSTQDRAVSIYRNNSLG